MHTQPWPEAREDIDRTSDVEIAVQVDGRLRGVIVVSGNPPRDEVIAAARDRVPAAPSVQATGRVVFVPGRVVNFVSKTG